MMSLSASWKGVLDNEKAAYHVTYGYLHYNFVLQLDASATNRARDASPDVPSFLDSFC